MAKVKIDIFGTKEYFNDDGDLHREDGPAQIWQDGTKFWYVNGVDTSINDFPAEQHPEGIMAWLQDGMYNREDKPAWMTPNGYKSWHLDGDIIWPEL